MPFTQKMLVMYSPLQLILVIAAVFTLLAVFGVLSIGFVVPRNKLKIHNDVAGPIFGVIGTIYAVMLAFVVVITWQSHDVTKERIDNEVSGLIGLFMGAEGLKDPMRTELRAAILDYGSSVVSDEWKDLKVGRSSPATASSLYRVMKLTSSYEPTTKAEEICLSKSLEKIEQLFELRRLRQLDSRDGIHPILWIALISGGIITVLASCIFGTETVGLQMIMTVSLALLIALVLFTIVELDFPFTGKMGLKPTAFAEMVERLKAY